MRCFKVLFILLFSFKAFAADEFRQEEEEEEEEGIGPVSVVYVKERSPLFAKFNTTLVTYAEMILKEVSQVQADLADLQNQAAALASQQNGPNSQKQNQVQLPVSIDLQSKTMELEARLARLVARIPRLPLRTACLYRDFRDKDFSCNVVEDLPSWTTQYSIYPLNWSTDLQLPYTHLPGGVLNIAFNKKLTFASEKEFDLDTFCNIENFWAHDRLLCGPYVKMLDGTNIDLYDL